MGGIFGKMTQANILVLGLDNSGKSTVINSLKPLQVKNVNVGPTIGITVEKFRSKSVEFTANDVSGK
jgi:ADP-ribosylation factor-like protein 6